MGRWVFSSVAQTAEYTDLRAMQDGAAAQMSNSNLTGGIVHFVKLQHVS